MWLDDVLGTKRPAVEHVVTDLGGGKYFHSFKSAQPTEAERQAAEDAAIREFDQQLAPDIRLPTTQPRQSPFSTTPNPDSFPS